MKFESDFVPTEKEVISRTCPECGNKLIVRKNAQTKQLFVACTQYPECKFADKIEIESKNQTNFFDIIEGKKI